MSQKSKDLPDEDIPALVALMTVGLCVTALMIAISIGVFVALEGSETFEGDGWKIIFTGMASVVGVGALIGILTTFDQWLRSRRRNRIITSDIMDDGDDSGEYSD